MSSFKGLILACIAVLAMARIVEGYTIKPTSLTAVGHAKKGEFLWKPSRALTINSQIAFTSVSKSKDDCGRRSTPSCKYAVLFTTDGGDKWNLDTSDAIRNFCGSQGIVNVDKATISCFSKQIEEKNTEESITVGYRVYQFLDEQVKLLESGADADLPTEAVFNIKNFSLPADQEYGVNMPLKTPVKLRFGDRSARFKEGNTLGINIELQLANLSYIHTFFKSIDNGLTWTFVSIVPFPFGYDTAIHVISSTKSMILGGVPNNYTYATSKYIGEDWGAIKNASYSSPLSTYTSEYFTTIYGGIKGRPGLHGMAAGAKRGSEMMLDFSLYHNRLVTLMADAQGAAIEPYYSNFSREFQMADKFDCAVGGSKKDSDGCATSSYTSVLSLKNDTVFVIYDKSIDNGYNPSTGKNTDQTLFVMKFFLNETKEYDEYIKKQEDEKEREEKKKLNEEKRREAKKEAERQKRLKRREKRKEMKRMTSEYREMQQGSIEEAKKGFAIDQDPIIVREVDLDYIEQEKDIFFEDLVPPVAASESVEL
eukprot:Tbor_TRINITY_DN3423_c0_g1::TRINITY_DN3423_c0_g1_i1::g.3668::m.3668